MSTATVTINPTVAASPRPLAQCSRCGLVQYLGRAPNCRKCGERMTGPPPPTPGYWEVDNERALEELPRRIREARAASGLTLRALSAIVGLSISSLSKIERNRSGTTPANLGALAKALNVPVASLFGQPSILADPLVFGTLQLLPKLSKINRQTIQVTIRAAAQKYEQHEKEGS